MTVRASDLKRPLASRLRDDRERLRVQGSAATLARSGMSVTAEDEVTVSGDLIVGGELAVHGSAAFDGNTTIGGNAAITGTLSLPAGIINNDALASPVIPGSVWQTASNFALNTSWSTVVTATVTVPTGVTSAAVSAKGSVTGFMNQDSPDNVDYLYGMLFVASASSGTYPLAVSDLGGSGTVHVFRDTVLTGLTPGGSFIIALQASTGYETWTSPSSPGNSARLGASIQWYR